MVGLKLEWGGDWKNVNNLVNVFNEFLLLKFKMFCDVLFCNFLLNLYSFC